MFFYRTKIQVLLCFVIHRYTDTIGSERKTCMYYPICKTDRHVNLQKYKEPCFFTVQKYKYFYVLSYTGTLILVEVKEKQACITLFVNRTDM